MVTKVESYGLGLMADTLQKEMTERSAKTRLQPKSLNPKSPLLPMPEVP